MPCDRTEVMSARTVVDIALTGIRAPPTFRAAASTNRIRSAVLRFLLGQLRTIHTARVRYVRTALALAVRTELTSLFDQAVHRYIRVAWESALPPTLWAIATLATYAVFAFGAGNVWWDVPLQGAAGKLYVISLFVTLCVCPPAPPLAVSQLT
jgi:hypothetical protein